MQNKFFILLVLAAVLAGCAGQPPVPQIADAQQYQQQLAQLDRWQLEGKIGVRHANSSDSAALRWQQNDEQFDIYLSGPLGAGATQLIGNPKQLIIRNDTDEVTATADPGQLLEKHLGWTLPLEKLPQWIVGASDNNNAYFNSDHTLAGFNEASWQVNYKSYQVVGPWLLPEKIVLKHEDMQVIIVIKQWDLH